ncbi:MAG: MFS transporter [Clostridiaceae bacterium]|jgi:oligogalacturonide transporter|nr:MFS transporter [Clostridiaceae bacterium]
MNQETAGAKIGYGVGRRLMYGMAEFFGGGVFVVINTFFTVFLIKALGVPAALAGIIPLVGHIWDAITDPIMGNITDRTSHRFGPKRFYILLGSIVSVLTFILMWVHINTTNNTLLFIYYALSYVLFSTGFTILMVPYNGLLPDMIDDYGMRARFSNVRTIWSTLGAMVCGLVPSLIIKDNTEAGAYLKVALILGVFFLLTSLVTFVSTWEKRKEPVQSKLSESFSQAGSTLHNKSFKLFLGIYLGGQCGMDFVSGLAVYYVDDVLNGYENGYFIYLMAVLLISQLVGMIFWGPVMVKKSKKFTVLVGGPMRIIATLGLLAFSYEGAPIIPVLVCTGFVGIGNAATLTSIFAILSDMADVDELVTSVRRPGVVSGMATFVRKISSGLSASGIGFLLSAVGYDALLASSGARQSLATQKGIVYIFVFAPVILVAIMLICGYLFPITGKEFKIIQTDIARRKGEITTPATEEEKLICEKVTGVSYENLWNAKYTHFKKPDKAVD